MDEKNFIHQLEKHQSEINQLIHRRLPVLIGRMAKDHFHHLFASIKYTPGDACVTIANDLLYAPIHNWGGSTHPSVTNKMRRFAWAMFYKETGIKRAKSGKTKKKRMAAATENSRASRWKALALTKKTKLNTRIPQRQFIGDSRELSDKVQQKIITEIDNILNA